MPVIETIMAIFSGVSAVSAGFELYKKWRDRRREKKSSEAAQTETTFNRVPQIIRNTCNTCVQRAGQRFHVGDEIASSSIVKATKGMSATLSTMLDLAISGRTLDLSNVRNIVDGFGQNLVQSMASLFTRLQQTRPSEGLRAHHHAREQQQEEVAPVQSDTPFYDPQPETPAAPLAPLAPEPIAKPADLKATLDAIRSNCSVAEYGRTLEQDLDAIAATPFPAIHQQRPAIESLASWSVLQRITERNSAVRRIGYT